MHQDLSSGLEALPAGLLWPATDAQPQSQSRSVVMNRPGVIDFDFDFEDAWMNLNQVRISFELPPAFSRGIDDRCKLDANSSHGVQASRCHEAMSYPSQMPVSWSMGLVFDER